MSDATIRSNGLYTEYDATALAALLCTPSALRRGLVIPYRTLNGAVDRFARVRPHHPRTREGKVAKYVQPAGSPLRAYFPVGSLNSLRDGASPIYVTEGEKKALALSQLDVAAIGIGGIWCGCKKSGTGGHELIDDLAAIPWSGRTVYVVFDYDTKEQTRRAAAEARNRLARVLLRAGVKEVRTVELPPGANGGKQGVDDFLVAHGAEEFRQLVADAEPVSRVPPLTKPEGRTDTANVGRLVAKHGKDLRWVGPWDKFLLWDDRRWKHDQSLAIDLRAKEVAAELFTDIAALLKSDHRPDDKATAAMLGHAKYSNSKDGVRNMVALAKSEVAIGPEQLDRDPWLLNVDNGTLDLRTGTLRPHTREDLLTKLAPVTYDPGARCSHWDGFLQKIFSGNTELIGYLQRLVGYCLTGDTSEHLLPFLYGTGANGKSTFVEVVLKLLGADYSMKAAPDLLMNKRGESHPTDRADLFGKRFVACVETEEGRRMAEALTKELTGGDRVRARRMREDFWEFTPTHHVWLAGNHKPAIVGTDNGIWRRVKLVPFDVTIPESEQDKKLPEKLAAELPGILNWALAGCSEWLRDGMREPAIVRTKTTEYSTEQDEVGQFLDEHCEIGAEFMAPAGELYRAFQQAAPDSHVNQHAFGARLRQKGFSNRNSETGKEYRTTKGSRGWKGLRLRSGAEREAERADAQAFLGRVTSSKGGKS